MKNFNGDRIIREKNEKLFLNNMSVKARYDLTTLKNKFHGKKNIFERSTNSLCLDQDILTNNKTNSKDFGYFTHSNIEKSAQVKKISSKFLPNYTSYCSVTPQKMKFKSKLPLKSSKNISTKLNLKSNSLGFTMYSLPRSTNYSLFKLSKANKNAVDSNFINTTQAFPKIPNKGPTKKPACDTTASTRLNFYKLNNHRILNEQLLDIYSDVLASRAKIDQRFDERIEQLRKMKFEG
jgi:hypothetical protein